MNKISACRKLINIHYLFFYQFGHFFGMLMLNLHLHLLFIEMPIFEKFYRQWEIGFTSWNLTASENGPDYVWNCDNSHVGATPYVLTDHSNYRSKSKSCQWWAIITARKRSWGKVKFSQVSVCLFTEGIRTDHYPWCIGPHCAPLHPTWDMYTYNRE